MYNNRHEKFKDLWAIIVAITRRTDINLVVTNEWPGTFTDFKNIVISNLVIPSKLRAYPQTFKRLQDGLATHEAGHWRYTLPYVDILKMWGKKHNNTLLARYVDNMVADKITNSNLLMAYRHDLGIRLSELMGVIGRSWCESLKDETKKIAATAPWLPKEILESVNLPALVGMRGLYGVDVSDVIANKEEQKEIDKCVEILDKVAYSTVPKDIIQACDQIHKILKEKLDEALSNTLFKAEFIKLKKVRDYVGKTIPVFLGGLLELEGDTESISRAKEEAEEEKARAERKLQAGVKAGPGSGLEIPAPAPNLEEYGRLVQKNATEITRLLNLLKKRLTQQIEKNRWQKRGRFMSEVLGKSYVSSLRKEINNIYQKKDIIVEKKRVFLGLLVDISASMDIMDAKDALTIIGETGLRWLKDEQLSILVFGSEFQKIKVFVEPSHTTRSRIGGVQCLGGTVMEKPLEALHKMFNSLRGDENTRKILVICSDFQVEFGSKINKEVKKQIDLCERDGITVLGVGLCGSDLQSVKKYVKGDQATYVDNIRQLPELFYDIYQKATESYKKV